MNAYPQPIQRCLQELEKLPGIGKRSAQRILFYLLGRGPESAAALAAALREVTERMEPCCGCRAYREMGSACPFCDDPRRDGSLLCVVETPADVFLVEATSEYRGLYHVLHGLMSPLRGITPEKLGMDALERRLGDGAVREVILATPPTAEGEATAAYIGHLFRGRVARITRIGFGLPVGTDLQFVDAQTLSRSLSGRRDY